MENHEFLYETLSTLGADKTPSPPRPPPSPSSKTEPYTVLRNQISDNNFQFPSPESAAPDYFSLDVNEAVDNETSISATLPPLREAGETSAPASERTFEGNWFRANSRFKSPMLRLHKGLRSFGSLFPRYSNWYTIASVCKLSNLGSCLVHRMLLILYWTCCFKPSSAFCYWFLLVSQTL